MLFFGGGKDCIEKSAKKLQRFTEYINNPLPRRHTNTIQNTKDIMKCGIYKRHCTTDKTAVEGRSSSYIRLLSWMNASVNAI